MVSYAANQQQTSADSVTPNFAEAVAQLVLFNFEQQAEDILAETETSASVRGGSALANADASALTFNDAEFSSVLFSESFGFIDYGPSLVAAKAGADVAATFSVEKGETFSFEFSGSLELLSKEIHESEDKYARAEVISGFFVVDFENEDDPDILAYAIIFGILITTATIGGIIIENNTENPDAVLDLISEKDVDVGGDNDVDFVVGDFFGHYSQQFAENAEISIIQFDYSAIELIDDTLLGLLGDDAIFGTTGDDTLTGSGVFGDLGDDEIFGLKSDDVLVGGGGDDTLWGGGGGDSLGGGDGNDVLDPGRGDDYILAGFGDDVIKVRNSQAVGDTMKGGYGWDKLINDNGGPIVLNTFGPVNSIEEIEGSWRDIRGTSGDDFLDFSATVLTKVSKVDGRSGNDTIRGSQDDDHLLGGVGNDEIDGQGGDDLLEGGLGADMLFGGNGDDTLLGGAKDDTLNGGNGSDVLDGGWGADVNIGGAGDDLIKVRNDEALNDTFDGGDGFDTIVNYGSGPIKLTDFGPANNIESIEGTRRGVVGTSGDNAFDFSKTDLNRVSFVDGGDGNDTIVGSSGDDEIRGKGGRDDLFGGEGDDILTGDADNDTLNGNLGRDSLNGGTAEDVLDGGGDDDILDGGRHDDTVTGGAGADVFVLRDDFGSDVFTDFDLDEGDRITNFNNRRSVQDVQFAAGIGYEVHFAKTSDILTVEALVWDSELEGYLANDFMLL